MNASEQLAKLKKEAASIISRLLLANALNPVKVDTSKLEELLHAKIEEPDRATDVQPKGTPDAAKAHDAKST